MRKVYFVSNPKCSGEFYFDVCDIHGGLYHSKIAYDNYYDAAVAAMHYINANKLNASPYIYQYV